MGCCQSSLSPMDRIAYEYILTFIPVHCKQEIMNLSPQKFLTIYRKHLAAENHLERKEYLAAIVSECQAIEELEVLLNHHKDHFIFADMHNLLSICYWEMGNIGQAFVRSLIALAIRIKYTPTDYTEISLHFFRFALIYIVEDELKEAEECLTKAIITGRLSIVLSQTYVQRLEETLAYVRGRIRHNAQIKPIVYRLTPNPDESQEDFLRRAKIDEILSIYTGIGVLQIDVIEYERLPDKETESQINDEIFNDVLKSLENYLNEDLFLLKFGTNGGCASFIAAYFKATQMKTSSLSTAMIEAALTIIINKMNDETTDDDERYAVVKQSPFTISYTDDDESRVKGVRVFQVKGKNSSKP